MRPAKLLARLEAVPRWWFALGGAVWVAAVAVADRLTGSGMPLTILYLPVIFAAGWLRKARTALVLSLVCPWLWVISDAVFPPAKPPRFAQYWIAAVHSVFFVLLTVTIGRLQAARALLQIRAAYDGRTGLLSGQYFMSFAAQEIERCRRAGEPLALAFIDCDDFKTVNDTLGHLEGDDLLLALAGTMQQSVGPADAVARVGGDEFAILMPGATRAEAERTVGRLQAAVGRIDWASKWPVTLSIGVAVFLEPPASVDDLIRAADDLMYAVKRSGKNAARYEVCGRQ